LIPSASAIFEVLRWTRSERTAGCGLRKAVDGYGSATSSDKGLTMYDRIYREAAAFEAATDRHPGWHRSGVKIDDSAPDYPELLEWYRRSFPDETRAIEARVGEDRLRRRQREYEEDAPCFSPRCAATSLSRREPPRFSPLRPPAFLGRRTVLRAATPPRRSEPACWRRRRPRRFDGRGS
jgi:hypothetical protein